MMVIPKGKDIKAARSYLEWTQKDLADKLGLTVQSINLIENGKQEPSKETEQELIKIFNQEDIIFHEEGGFKVNKSQIKIFEGKDAYLKVQEDIIQTMMYGEGEVLYFGSDEKKSTDKVIENEIKMVQLRIPSKTLAALGDTYFMGELESYRLIDPAFFSQNVTTIYGDKAAFSLNVDGLFTNKIIVINDKQLANSFRRQFYNLWEKGEKTKKSTAPTSYKKLSKQK